MNPKMLQGYKVLELGQGIAAPLCGQMLAQMGAEVIKVELAPGGDRLREIGVQSTTDGPGNTSYFVVFNQNKRSLCVDIRSAEGRAAVDALIASVDVVIENFSPGVIANYGWGYARLRELNPSIIMLSSSAVGQTGPLSSVKGYDWIGQAYSGLMNAVGEGDRPPSLLAAGIGDVSTALANTMGIAVALLHRERTGEGQYLEASLLDTYMLMNEANVVHASLRKDETVGRRAGAIHPAGPLTGIYRSGDGFVALTTAPHLWPALAKLMGHPELVDDPRFATHDDRTKNGEPLFEIIRDWFATFANRDEAVAALQGVGIPSAPVFSVYEAISHPHMIERGTVRWVDDPGFGRLAVAGLPVKFSGWAGPEGLEAPTLGEDNHDVLTRVAGLDAAKVAELEAAGALGPKARA